MAILLPTLSPTPSLPDPLNINLETAVISGDLHKLYLSNTLPCTNIITNGGADNTTDWTNPTNGLAQYWSVSQTSSFLTPSIVTGNGFTGNAQRCELIATVGNFTLWNTNTTLLSGNSYRVTLKYRSSFDLQVIAYKTAGGLWSTYGTLTTNTGNAADSGVVNLTSLTDNSYLCFGVASTTASGHWFEVDVVHCCTI